MQFQNRNKKRTLYPERSQNVALMPELLYMISATTSSRMRDDHQHPSNPNSINPNSKNLCQYTMQDQDCIEKDFNDICWLCGDCPCECKKWGGEIEEEGSNYTSTNSETPNSKVRKCLYR